MHCTACTGAAPSSSTVDARERWPYALFFTSLVAVGAGSTHYHLAPDNETLFWDRLPMSVAFNSLFGTVLIERAGAGDWRSRPQRGCGVC